MIYLIAFALLSVASYVMLRRAGAIPQTASLSFGPLTTYFKQITRLQLQGIDSFFVTAMASDKITFVQVSVTQNGADNWHYQFDLPVTAWSEAFSDQIEDEARARGLTTHHVNGTNEMSFLDVDFTDRVAHDAFTTWVIEEVFGLPKDEVFEITWG
ncbi:MAG: hypothetical protein ABJF50_13535 [Paracoccaceae bacterium]